MLSIKRKMAKTPEFNFTKAKQVVVDLNISEDEFLRVYRGSARTVLAYSIDGRRVSFPANILQPYVTRTGIRGRFRIRFDTEGRFSSIEKLV